MKTKLTSKKILGNKNFIFTLSMLLTLVVAFWMPVSSYFLPLIASKMGVEFKNEKHAYSMFSDDTIYITDEWEFYWDELLVTDEKEFGKPDAIVSLPSSWTTYELNGEPLKYGGVATYRTFINDFFFSEPITISLLNFPGIYKAYIDGELVSSNCGNIDDIRDTNSSSKEIKHSPKMLNYKQDGKYEIVIEVSCEFSSGITVLPILTQADTFDEYMTNLLVFRYFIIGMVAMFAISIIAMSAVAFKDGRFFWLIVFCITFIFRMIINDNGHDFSGLLYLGLNHEIVLSLIYATTYILKLSFFMHVTRSLRIKVSDNFMVAISAMFLVCIFLPQFKTEMLYDTGNFMFLQAVSYVLDFYLIYKLSVAVSKNKRFSIPYLIATCVFVASIIIDNYFINGYISKNATFVFPIVGFLFMLTILVIQIIRIGEAYVAEMKTASLTQELADVNMTLMLSQIQPHFLYNALNTIKYLIKKDPKTAEQVVVKFAKYLRANMDSLTQKDPLPVEKELDHVANYTDIEKQRFGNRLEVKYEVECKSFVILPLTIQPIVENAIKHGINQKPEGGTVTIRTYEDEKFYYVDITDDGVGYDVNQKPDPNDKRSHVGINNIKVRLKEKLNATVTVKSVIGEGTTVLVMIPKNDETRYEEC